VTRRWETLATVATAEGALELRRRGAADFLITVAGRVLMTSAARRSEEALAELACARLCGRPAPRLLLGGLGMGFTLRAALDALPVRAEVTVAELSSAVVDWCRGPLAPLTDAAVLDPRVTVRVADVAAIIAAAAPGAFDAIVLDLYEGPYPSRGSAVDPIYGAAGLAAARAALAPGGVLAIWAEDVDEAFVRVLGVAGFRATIERAGRGGRRHVVYLGA
jgi:spermidine synthase